MKKILLAVTILVAVTSCKKDKDDENCTLSSTSIVGSYKTTAVKYKASAADAEIDEFATWDACEKDDIVVLNANNSVTYQDAGISCTPSTNDTGAWLLSGSSLNIDGEIYTVTAFSCSGMTLTRAGTTVGELSTITVVRL